MMNDKEAPKTKSKILDEIIDSVLNKDRNGEAAHHRNKIKSGQIDINSTNEAGHKCSCRNKNIVPALIVALGLIVASFIYAYSNRYERINNSVVLDKWRSVILPIGSEELPMMLNGKEKVIRK